MDICDNFDEHVHLKTDGRTWCLHCYAAVVAERGDLTRRLANTDEQRNDAVVRMTAMQGELADAEHDLKDEQVEYAGACACRHQKFDSHGQPTDDPPTVECLAHRNQRVRLARAERERNEFAQQLGEMQEDSKHAQDKLADAERRTEEANLLAGEDTLEFQRVIEKLETELADAEQRVETAERERDEERERIDRLYRRDVADGDRIAELEAELRAAHGLADVETDELEAKNAELRKLIERPPHWTHTSALEAKNVELEAKNAELRAALEDYWRKSRA